MRLSTCRLPFICRPGFSHRSTSDSQVLVNRYLGGLVDCSRVLETAWPPEPSPLCHTCEVGAAPNELSTTTMGYFRRAGPICGAQEYAECAASRPADEAALEFLTPHILVVF